MTVSDSSSGCIRSGLTANSTADCVRDCLYYEYNSSIIEYNSSIILYEYRAANNQIQQSVVVCSVIETKVRPLLDSWVHYTTRLLSLLPGMFSSPRSRPVSTPPLLLLLARSQPSQVRWPSKQHQPSHSPSHVYYFLKRRCRFPSSSIGPCNRNETAQTLNIVLIHGNSNGHRRGVTLAHIARQPTTAVQQQYSMVAFTVIESSLGHVHVLQAKIAPLSPTTLVLSALFSC